MTPDVVTEAMIANTPAPGPDMLNAWMDETGVSSVTLAAAVGVVPSAISGYRNRQYTPVMIVAEKIERFTLGRVPRGSWYTPAQKAEVLAVVPWSKL